MSCRFDSCSMLQWSLSFKLARTGFIFFLACSLFSCMAYYLNPSFWFDKDLCLSTLYALDEGPSPFIKSEEDCGEMRDMDVFFHTTCYGNEHSPRRFADRCSSLGKKSPFSWWLHHHFEMSVSSRLLSSRGQGNGRRKTDERVARGKNKMGK